MTDESASSPADELGSRASEIAKVLSRASIPDSARKVLETMESMKQYDFLDQLTRSSLAGRLAEIGDSQARIPTIQRIQPVDLKALQPPRLEDTKVGKATLATASKLDEVVRLNSEIVTHVSGLAEMFVRDVFPQWQRKLEEDQAAAAEVRRLAEEEAACRQTEAQASLNKANKSLVVAVWALVASVVVTIGTAGWQLWVAKQYREEDVKSLAASGSVAAEQLKELKAMRAALPAVKEPSSESTGASQLSPEDAPQPPPGPRGSGSLN